MWSDPWWSCTVWRSDETLLLKVHKCVLFSERHQPRFSELCLSEWILSGTIISERLLLDFNSSINRELEELYMYHILPILQDRDWLATSDRLQKHWIKQLHRCFKSPGVNCALSSEVMGEPITIRWTRSVMLSDETMATRVKYHRWAPAFLIAAEKNKVVQLIVIFCTYTSVQHQRSGGVGNAEAESYCLTWSFCVAFE